MSEHYAYYSMKVFEQRDSVLSNQANPMDSAHATLLSRTNVKDQCNLIYKFSRSGFDCAEYFISIRYALEV